MRSTSHRARAPRGWSGPFVLGAAVLAAGLTGPSLASASPAADDVSEPPAPPATGEGVVEEETRHARTSGGFGFDVRFGLPNGALSAPWSLGLDLTWNPVAPLVFSAGVDSSVITWSGHVEAQLNILSIFDPESSVTPFVRSGFTHLRFTRRSDELIDTFFPTLREDLQDAGTDLRFAGVNMNLVTVSAGIDHVSDSGFHFQLAVGRALLLGESKGRNEEESVVFTSYTSWTFQMMFGALFF